MQEFCELCVNGEAMKIETMGEIEDNDEDAYLQRKRKPGFEPRVMRKQKRMKKGE